MKSYIKPDEVTMMEEAAGNLRDRLLIRILFRLGCRVSEALSLQVEDIDPIGGRVTIKHLKYRLRLLCPSCENKLGRSHKYCPKCGRQLEDAQTEMQMHQRFRSLPLDKVTLDLIREYIDRGGPVIRNGKRLIFGINRHRA